MNGMPLLDEVLLDAGAMDDGLCTMSQEGLGLFKQHRGGLRVWFQPERAVYPFKQHS